MLLKDLLERLEGVRPSGKGKYLARCPAHDDHSPSLSIVEGRSRAFLHCFAGCTRNDVYTALGIGDSDLFYEAMRTSVPYTPKAKALEDELLALPLPEFLNRCQKIRERYEKEEEYLKFYMGSSYKKR
jgi:putative DNA primase/helicase